MLKKFFFLVGIALVAFAVMMATTGQAKLTLESEALLSASTSEVWQHLVAVEDWHNWWPGVESARVTPALQAGALLDLVLKGDSSRKPARVETVTVERRLGWIRSGVLGSTTHTGLRLIPLGEETRVSMTIAIHGPQAFLARLSARDKLTAYQQAVLESLRLHLEQAAVELKDLEAQ
jgi:hypothetical protein